MLAGLSLLTFSVVNGTRRPAGHESKCRQCEDQACFRTTERGIAVVDSDFKFKFNYFLVSLSGTLEPGPGVSSWTHTGLKVFKDQPDHRPVGRAPAWCRLLGEHSDHRPP